MDQGGKVSTYGARITHPFLTMFYPLLQFSFFRFSSEKSVLTTIVVKLIVFCSRKCLREEIDSRDMFNIFVGPVLKPKETHSLYTLLSAFYWLGGDFLFIHFHLRGTNPTLIA